MRLKTEPRSMHEAIEAEYAAAARAKPVRRPPDLDKSGVLDIPYPMMIARMT